MLGCKANLARQKIELIIGQKIERLSGENEEAGSKSIFCSGEEDTFGSVLFVSEERPLDLAESDPSWGVPTKD